MADLKPDTSDAPIDFQSHGSIWCKGFYSEISCLLEHMLADLHIYAFSFIFRH